MDPKGNKYRYEALITMTGRKPLCLRCKKVGDVRKECFTPYCNNCEQFGHYPGECKKPDTWARKVRTKDGNHSEDTCSRMEAELVQAQVLFIPEANSQSIQEDPSQLLLATAMNDQSLATVTESLHIEESPKSQAPATDSVLKSFNPESQATLLLSILKGKTITIYSTRRCRCCTHFCSQKSKIILLLKKFNIWKNWEKNSIKIITLNVNGLREQPKKQFFWIFKTKEYWYCLSTGNSYL